MNAHVPAMQRSLSDVVAEYDVKKAALLDEFQTFTAAGNALKMAATIGGTFGQVTIETGRVYESTLFDHLLKSAWLHIYAGLNIKVLSSPREQKLFEQAMAKPAPFTLDNIRATFGRFLIDPRASILRAMAEVFCELDQAYKSHDKVKIGVAGLPKRVVMSGFGRYSTYGRDKLQAIMNALSAYQGKPLMTYEEIHALIDDTILLDANGRPRNIEAERGVRLKTFQNGNGHLFFEPTTLRDINRALAEFYGDVLPDTTDEKPAKPAAGTSVSKELQYYPTPQKVIDNILHDMHSIKGELWLEPSCGDGRILDAMRRAGASVYGIEVDFARAADARQRHSVLCANFLDCIPEPIYDGVLMNPPFYGKHYAKHVRHAFKFLKPGGILKAILPITARYDHGLLDDMATSRWGNNWSDLPVGAFSESGTNINTTVFTTSKPKPD